MLQRGKWVRERVKPCVEPSKDVRTFQQRGGSSPESEVQMQDNNLRGGQDAGKRERTLVCEALNSSGGQRGLVWKPLGSGNATRVVFLLSERLAACINSRCVVCLPCKGRAPTRELFLIQLWVASTQSARNGDGGKTQTFRCSSAHLPPLCHTLDCLDSRKRHSLCLSRS